MIRYRLFTLITLSLIVAVTVMACASANNANLKRVDSSKEKELRQNWKDYTIFTRTRDNRSFQPGPAAILYKIKNNKKILLDNRWKETTNGDVGIAEMTTTAEILGQNGELYGYLVYRTEDSVSVKIIDEQTVRLGYAYLRNYRF